MKKLYIFKVGETFKNTKSKVGDFDNWIKNFINTNEIDIEVINILDGDIFPLYESCLGVIITGSHSMVTENLEWSVKTENWIQKAKDLNVPILGICYGHQLIGKALGGKVDNNPKGKEIGCVEVFVKEEIKEDLLFKELPNSFLCNVTHLQSVLELPVGAISLGFNNHDKNQIVRFSNSIWGIQFHPEFDEIIMEEYIKEQEEELKKMSLNINSLIEGIKETKYSNSILEKFVCLIKSVRF